MDIGAVEYSLLRIAQSEIRIQQFLTIDHLAVFLQPHRGFRLRVGARGHRADREQREIGGMRKYRLDRLKRGIDRSIAGGTGSLESVDSSRSG